MNWDVLQIYFMLLNNIWLDTKVIFTKDFPDAGDYAHFLFGNYLGLITHGDEEASI